MIGQKIQNYEVRSLLGEGGMGSVYVAEHPLLGRRAAMKVLRKEYADDPTLVGRFINEARAASAIQHPGIIEMFDVGTLADGVPYLMMELLEGETLGRRIERQGRLPIPEAVDIAIQAASALAAAHGHGIVHRDLKPENLFLVPNPALPGRHRVKVLDFGIAKLQRRLSGQSIRTHTGSIMGTPPYMSPEQCRGISSEIDHRTDVYAMGIILYEMLTGAPPFLSEGFGDVLLMHLTQPPRPPRELEPTIPPSLDQLVLWALEKEPDKRLPSMEELQRALAGPAARTTVRQAGDPAVNADSYAPTEAIPRPARGSSARGTTFSSTASQIVPPDTERLERLSVVRRRRVALGLVGAGLVGVAVLAFGTGGRSQPPVTLDRPGERPAEGPAGSPSGSPPGAKLSASAVQPPSPAPNPVAPIAGATPAAAPPTADIVPPLSTAPPPSTAPAVPPRAQAAGAEPVPAAAPPIPPARRNLDKRTKLRSKKDRASVSAGAPSTAPRAPEFAPLPDHPAGAVGAPPASSPTLTRPTAPPTPKPRLSTDKW